MEEFFKAIMTQWGSDIGARARELIPGGLWIPKAPQDVIDSDPTYAVFTFLPGTVSDTNTSKIEEPIGQFAIFATDEDEKVHTAWAARDALVKVYDDRLLSMEPDADNNPRRMIMAQRQTVGQLIPDPDKGYSVVIDYRFMFTTE